MKSKKSRYEGLEQVHRQENHDDEVIYQQPQQNMAQIKTPNAQAMQPQYVYPAPSHSGGGAWLFLIVLGVGFFIFELYFAPPELSVIERIMEKLGKSEAKYNAEIEKSQAELEFALQTAKAEVERISKFYEVSYTLNAEISKIAWQMENQLFNAQLESLNNTQGAERFGANVASLGCMLGGLLGDAMISGVACGAKEDMQDEILSRQTELMERHRSQIPEQIMDSLKNPRDIVSPEFKSLMNRYQAKFGN